MLFLSHVPGEKGLEGSRPNMLHHVPNMLLSLLKRDWKHLRASRLFRVVACPWRKGSLRWCHVCSGSTVEILFLLHVSGEKGLEGKTGSQLGPNRAHPNISHHAPTLFFPEWNRVASTSEHLDYLYLWHVLGEKGPLGDAMFVWH